MVSRSSIRFGVLCEDETDFETLKELVSRIAREGEAKPGDFGFKGRYGGGCGKLRKKAKVWAEELADKGCEAIILVHDLDRVRNRLNDEAELREILERIPMPAAMDNHLCIPIEELEAWFFSCPIVMREISGEEGHAHPSPHNIAGPKEQLMRLSRGKNKKSRFSTNDNPKYAKILDLDTCARLCPSFRGLRDFVRYYTANLEPRA
jgi:hypothetical protein